MKTEYIKHVNVVTAVLPTTIKAEGWYISQPDGVTVGEVKHAGNPWSVNPAELLPVSPHSGIYRLKIEIEDAGNGSTTWRFSYRKAAVGPDSIRVSSDTFWETVSMATVPATDRVPTHHTYLGRRVTGITIHLEPLPKVMIQELPYHPGGAL